jgi:hypothetical protein
VFGLLTCCGCLVLLPQSRKLAHLKPEEFKQIVSFYHPFPLLLRNSSLTMTHSNPKSQTVQNKFSLRQSIAPYAGPSVSVPSTPLTEEEKRMKLSSILRTALDIIEEDDGLLWDFEGRQPVRGD